MRHRISTLILLTAISALCVQNWMLRQELRKSRILLPTDTIAVSIPGVLDARGIPEIDVQDSTGLRSLKGLPISVADDRSITLPIVGRVSLIDMTAEEARTAIASAYRKSGNAIQDTDVTIEPVEKKSVTLAR